MQKYTILTICLFLISATSACALSTESESILDSLKSKHTVSDEKTTVENVTTDVKAESIAAAKEEKSEADKQIVALMVEKDVSIPDVIHLINGDRISGKLLNLFDKTVTIKAYATEAISIPLDQISSITTTDEYEVALDEGTVLEGTFEKTENGSFLINTEVGEVPVDMGQIVSVDNLPAVAEKKAAAEEAARFALHKVWKGRAALGFVDTTGNSTAKALSMSINSTRKTDKDKIYLDALYNKNTANGVTSADYITGGARMDIFLKGDRFYFLMARGDIDKIKLLDLRATIGGGVGLTFYDNDEEHLDMGIGVTYVRESYEGFDTDSSRELLYSLNYKKKLGEGISFEERLMFLPTIDDLGDYRIESIAGVNVALNNNFGLNLGFIYRYDKTPPAGSKRNDATFTTSISRDF